jgi:hypothetical protein
MIHILDTGPLVAPFRQPEDKRDCKIWQRNGKKDF